jgi:hypothetical protein
MTNPKYFIDKLLGAEYETIGDAINAWFAHTKTWPNGLEQDMLMSRVRSEPH